MPAVTYQQISAILAEASTVDDHLVDIIGRGLRDDLTFNRIGERSMAHCADRFRSALSEKTPEQVVQFLRDLSFLLDDIKKLGRSEIH
jgi:hypothetical protein